ncbi:MAG: hypothetical protein IJR19_02510 [Lachnospiraceae bacterium]|nr:hypothetical protein [Lachnospiraceae bacterium]MBQ7260205.1 hypothetical protein [Lachnospiraceae bacterium]HAV01264.1 hypothetical protein [Lachnospiraceae bacterium]
MQIGAVGTGYYQPYVYNTNSLSRASMKPVQGIGDDLLTSKTDFSALTDETKQNVNPLKRGETADFEGIVDMQMQMGRMNASRLFGNEAAAPVTESEETGAPNTEDSQYTQAIAYQPIDLFA